jgi:trigger factor
MQAELVDKQAVAATFKVTVPAEEVDAVYERVLAQLARQVNVPGFRPGRAPRGVLIKRIGPDALASEVREALVDDNYPKAVRELSLLPVHAHFHGEAPAAGQPFTFEVHADLYPEFELPDLDAITIDTRPLGLEEPQVEATIQRLRDDHATLVPVDRPVAEGDVVFVETLGDGGRPGMPIDLGRAEPRIVEQLVGKAAGDEVDLDLGPDEATDGTSEGEAPSGSETPVEPPRRRLAIRIEDVKAKELPEADDAFAQTLGFESWTAARDEIRTGLTRQLEREAEAVQRDEFIDKLVAATDIELPHFLVNRRKHGLLEDLSEDLERRQGTTLQAYVDALEERGAREAFEGELDEAARRAVRRDLVLEALHERRGTKVSDADFDAAVRHMASRERKDVKRFREDMGEEWLRNYRFLLERDRAVREIVAEKTGRAALSSDGTAAAAEAAEAAAAEAAGFDAEDDHDHHDHDHDHHDHEHRP